MKSMQSKLKSHIEIAFEQVTTFSPDIARDIRRLSAMIGSNYTELTENDLVEMIASPNTTLSVAKANNKIVGMVTLIVYRIPYVRKAYVDDLVVDAEYRGHGIGTQLMEMVLQFAQEKGASYIDFTARPRREESNRLYEKLGFKKRDTNVYRKIIHYAEV